MNPFLSRPVFHYLIALLVVSLVGTYVVGWVALVSWLLTAAGLLFLGRAWDRARARPFGGERTEDSERTQRH
jgi:hypothetical protein